MARAERFRAVSLPPTLSVAYYPNRSAAIRNVHTRPRAGRAWVTHALPLMLESMSPFASLTA